VKRLVLVIAAWVACLALADSHPEGTRANKVVSATAYKLDGSDAVCGGPQQRRANGAPVIDVSTCTPTPTPTATPTVTPTRTSTPTLTPTHT
jgi:hypothetical protein